MNNSLDAILARWPMLDSPLLRPALLLVAGLLLHLLLRLLLARLHRLAGKSLRRWDDVLLTAVEAPVLLLMWVLVINGALVLLPGASLPQGMLAQLYDTALVLLLTWFLQRLIRGVESELLQDEHGFSASSADRASVTAAASLLRILLWIVAGVLVLQSLDVSISGLLAFGGIGGIAVGFAAKDLLANFFGGLSIYLDRPFTVGDWIRSPDRTIEGTVEEIGWRLTCIRTFDQRPLYVPNAVFSQVAIENPSRMHNRRIYETIGLRYGDAAQVGAVVADVRKMLEQHPEIDTGRTLIVNFVSFGASSLDFFVYAFTHTTEWVRYHEIKQEILLRILEIIHARGADVAYPTRTLHLQGQPDAPQEAQ